MIPNCMGCKDELERAFEYAKKGLHLAVPLSDKRKHLFIIIVNNKGKIILY